MTAAVGAYEVMIMLMGPTGVRIEEVIGLDVGDVGLKRVYNHLLNRNLDDVALTLPADTHIRGSRSGRRCLAQRGDEVRTDQRRERAGHQ